MRRAASALAMLTLATAAAMVESSALAADRPASSGWTIDDRAERFLAKLIRDSDFPTIARTELVCLAWSEGGWATGPNHRRIPLRAEYALGTFDKNEPPPRTSFIVPSKLFGHICIIPKPEDARSTRRQIDYDGKDIVVR